MDKSTQTVVVEKCLGSRVRIGARRKKKEITVTGQHTRKQMRKRRTSALKRVNAGELG